MGQNNKTSRWEPVEASDIVADETLTLKGQAPVAVERDIYTHMCIRISNHYRILGMGDRACLATWYALRSFRGECSWSQGGRRSPRGPLSGKPDRGSEIPCREGRFCFLVLVLAWATVPALRSGTHRDPYGVSVRGRLAGGVRRWDPCQGNWVGGGGAHAKTRASVANTK